MNLTLHGGVNEIGGNKILLEDGKTRIFLDFGLSFSRRGKFFEEFLTPRTANGIGDFLEMGLLPDIKGIYREDLLRHMGRRPEKPNIDGVFLSHAHADHANYISFLHRDIPIYCGATCKSILEAVEEQRKRDIENEVLNFKPRPLFMKDRKKPPLERAFHTFRTGGRVGVKGLEIMPVHVDHSVPGAYGLIIRGSRTLVYTGDLRLHGRNPVMTREFIAKSSESRPDALLCEGTRVDVEEDPSSEEGVYAKALQYTARAKNLVIADFNFKDVDRFRTFYKIARETGRRLVISFKHACFLERYHRDPKLGVPDSKDKQIAILVPKRMTGTYCEGDYCMDPYIRRRLGYPNTITAEQIRRDQSSYMVVLNFWYFNELVDLKPKEGSVYIHSLSEPLTEEIEFSHERMLRWLKHFGLRYKHAHCSGHACQPDLKEIIETIRPKAVIPIHTEHPELFKGIVPKGTEIKRVESGGVYSF